MAIRNHDGQHPRPCDEFVNREREHRDGHKMITNLFTPLPVDLPEELFTTLLESSGLRVERIVSHGHASPEGFWFDQDRPEWVILLKGAARLRFEGDEQPLEMKPGDFVNIPARRRHRLEWTTPEEPTVWLAVHYGA